ncbi:unnamed protein product [Paramecium octaurelia]|uniref:Uncharacterized protein n=1 Tax=Paramecium octaurelia TaxID=43137 RepID=A0A8S1XCW6_PAROT|nr:unnamed protein product [Paramecium octaurelia]
MSKTIMLCFMLLSAFQALSTKNRCDCTLFGGQTECENVPYCSWSNNACGLKNCSNIILERCETFFRCSINPEGNCETTGDCSKYTATTQIDCMFKRGNCAAEATQTNGVYKCKSYTAVTCASQTAENCKNSFENENSFCWLNSQGKCQSYDPNTCAGIPLEICSNLGCDASGSECKAYTCASNLTVNTCILANDGYFGAKTLCKWNTTTQKCEERADITELTQNQCSLLTDGGYYWLDNKCTVCPTEDDTDDTSNAILLSSLLIIHLLVQ